VQRLRAPGLRATTGVTLAGQSFGTTTSTGELAGHFTATTLQPIRHQYVVELAPASAALLTLHTP
jgi:hypothetical protein